MGPEKGTLVLTKPRLIGLDLLRLLAVALVLGRHMEPSPKSWVMVSRLPFMLWARGGWVGVDLFFVLSGFLVSGLLFTEYKSRGCLGIGRFYTRRGWKIYPPFFALIAATVALNLSTGRPIPLRMLGKELLFLQSYLGGMWDHTWSLAVEEHFYFLLPLALASVLRWNQRSSTPFRPVIALGVVVAIGALLGRLLTWYSYPSFSFTTNLYASHLRLDSLFFGVVLSYLYHFHTHRLVELLYPWRRSLIIGGAALLAPAFAYHLETTPFIYTLGLTLFYVGSGMMLLGTLLCDFQHRRALVLLASLGAYSYSIYLWHMPVKSWLVPLMERIWGHSMGFGVRFPIYLIASVGLGVVMAKLVELPALRLRDRWFPDPGRGHLRASGTLIRRVSSVSCGDAVALARDRE